MQVFWCVCAGFIGGIIGGMGMGGGTLLIPLLTLFLGVEQHLAQGINLISFIPMSAVAIIIHAKNGLIKFKKIWVVALISAGFSVLGSFISGKISSGILSKILGGFFCILAVFQFVSLVKKSKKEGEKGNK